MIDLETIGYVYSTARQPREGWFARVLTYRVRHVSIAVYPRQEAVPESGKRRRIAPEFAATIEDNGDGTIDIGGHFLAIPRRIRRREIVSAGTLKDRRDRQRIWVRCDACRQEDEITLAAWCFAVDHGNEVCKACALRRYKVRTGQKIELEEVA